MLNEQDLEIKFKARKHLQAFQAIVDEAIDQGRCSQIQPEFWQAYAQILSAYAAYLNK